MLEIRLVVVARLTKVVSWFHSSKTAGLASKLLIPTKEQGFSKGPTGKQPNALQVSGTNCTMWANWFSNLKVVSISADLIPLNIRAKEKEGGKGTKGHPTSAIHLQCWGNGLVGEGVGLHLPTHNSNEGSLEKGVPMPSALGIIGAKMALKEFLLDFPKNARFSKVNINFLILARSSNSCSKLNCT